MHGHNTVLYVIPPPAEHAPAVGAPHILYPMAVFTVAINNETFSALREGAGIDSPLLYGDQRRITVQPLAHDAIVCAFGRRRHRDNEERLLPTVTREDAISIISDHTMPPCHATRSYLERMPPHTRVVLDWVDEHH